MLNMQIFSFDNLCFLFLFIHFILFPFLVKVFLLVVILIYIYAGSVTVFVPCRMFYFVEDLCTQRVLVKL